MAISAGHVPYADMESQTSNESIDEQLAADMDSRAIQRGYSDFASKLQKNCDEYHKLIMDAWRTIEAHTTAFDRRKKVILATLRRVEPDRADRIIRRGLDKMQPAAYDEIRKSMAVFPTASYASPQQSPVAARAQLVDQDGNDSDDDRPLFVTQGSPKAPPCTGSPKPLSSTLSPRSPPRPTSSETIRHMGLTAKRSAPQADIYDVPSSSMPTKRAKIAATTIATNNTTARLAICAAQSPSSATTTPSKPKHPDLYTFDVECQDFIFAEPSFGPGYYVVRCNHHDGNLVGINKPTQFSTDPWDGDEVTEHFNGAERNWLCHDGTRHYTRQEIMCEFAQRVTGPEVNKAWVERSNKRLMERLQGNSGPRQSTRGVGISGKGRGKGPDLGPARR